MAFWALSGRLSDFCDESGEFVDRRCWFIQKIIYEAFGLPRTYSRELCEDLFEFVKGIHSLLFFEVSKIRLLDAHEGGLLCVEEELGDAGGAVAVLLDEDLSFLLAAALLLI